MTRRPDFIVVGAPKCGTTSLYSYLRQSPYVYMPRKDLDHFGSDLEFSLPTPTRAEYERHFTPAGRMLTGDVSVWYLYSKTAAAEIYEYAPDTRIVIMLRNPVDFVSSMHRQALFQNDETEHSLEKALQVEQRRKRGEALPAGAYARHAVFYRDLARFSEQIDRYLHYFPRDNMCFIVLDDLAVAPELEWARFCAFVDISHEGVSQFSVENPHKRQRWPRVAKATTHFRRSVVPRLGLDRLPNSVKDLGKDVLRAVTRWNAVYVERPPMSPALRARLLEEFDDEITSLENILGRDLSSWRQ